MKAMVFAAGLGTRLRPLTDTMPKALVPVCGSPLLAHILCKLHAAGYTEAVVNVHHFSQQIRDYLAANDFEMKVSISDESDCLLETGGGIRRAKTLLEPLDEPFLAHNVDIISNADLTALAKQSRDCALATLLVSKRESSRYLLLRPDDLRLVGWMNVKTGQLRSPYPDLNPEKCLRRAFSGIQLLSRDIFSAFDEMNMPERFSIMDFYLQACDRYPIYGVDDANLTLVDVGKFDTLSEAERICSALC